MYMYSTTYYNSITKSKGYTYLLPKPNQNEIFSFAIWVWREGVRGC